MNDVARDRRLPPRRRPPTAADRLVVAYAEWVLRHRWWVALACLAVAAAAAWGAGNLVFNNNYRAFFSEQNPQRQAFEAIQNTYTKNDNLLFVVTPGDGDVFSANALALVQRLTDEAWRLPYAIRVDSITNFQHTRADGDDLLVEDLVGGDPASLTEAQRAALREVAVSEPLLRNRLIDADAAVTAVSVTFQMPDSADDPQAALEAVSVLVAEARALLADTEAAHPGTDLRLTGSVMMNNAFFESAQRDLATLVPLMYAGIVLVMLVLVRSVSATLATVVVIALSILTAMGLAGWAGIKLTSPSASAPTVIMTLAVADCIHIIVNMFAAMRGGLERRAAIVESLRINMQPVFLTSATTAVGFLTMNFSDVPPFRDLGNMAATGVMAAFFYAVLFLPAALAILPLRAHGGGGRSSEWMDRLADFVVERRNPLLLGTAAVSVAVLAFIPANELNDEFVKYFGESIEFRRDTDFATERLTGISQVRYSIPAGESNGVADPQFLATLERFADWYRTQPGVMHVSTITDTFKRLNKNLHGDDPAWYRLPERRDLAAQYLLLYELSLPFGLDLNNQLNIDKSATQVVVTVENLPSVPLRRLVAQSEQWLRDNAPSMYSPGIGISMMFAHISDRNIRSMLGGAILGLVLISGLILLALRSIRIGLVSLIPNLLPIGMVFGLWGIFVGQVNVAASVVSGMILGIVVDDTVHFLSKYLRARRERGYGPEDAVRFAFHTVGIALVVTTLILVAGFAVLAQSAFAINATMGTLTAIGIALALIIDFLLLPPLLMRLDGGGSKTLSTAEETAYAT